jgi:hypothetical protein
MLKFINEKGKLRYVLLDGDSQPRDIRELTKETLKKLGIVLEDDKYEELLKPSGVSQDDVKHLQGE